MKIKIIKEIFEAGAQAAIDSIDPETGERDKKVYAQIKKSLVDKYKKCSEEITTTKISKSHADTLNKRLEDYENNPNSVISSEEVHRKIKQKYNIKY